MMTVNCWDDGVQLRHRIPRVSTRDPGTSNMRHRTSIGQSTYAVLAISDLGYGHLGKPVIRIA